MRDDGTAFAEQDFRDLQILFNLAWTDPSWLENEPLAGLVAKGEGFTEEDKVILFGEHLRIIQEVMPAAPLAVGPGADRGDHDAAGTPDPAR